jgi:hypothetical protein
MPGHACPADFAFAEAIETHRSAVAVIIVTAANR